MKKLDCSEWYVNTYSCLLVDIPTKTHDERKFSTGAPFTIWDTSVLLCANVVVAIHRDAFGDREEDYEVEAFPEDLGLLSSKKKLNEEHRNLLSKYFEEGAWRKVLKIELTTDYQYSSLQDRKKIRLPQKYYEYLSIPYGWYDILSIFIHIYNFCLFAEGKSAMDRADYEIILEHVSIFACNILEQDYDTMNEKEVRQSISELNEIKEATKRNEIELPPYINEVFFQRSIETREGLLSLWLDYATAWLNSWERVYQEWKEESASAIIDFTYMIYRSLIDGLVDKGFIKICKGCGKVFQRGMSLTDHHWQMKLYCTPQCGDNFRRRKSYQKDIEEKRKQSKEYMQEYRELLRKYDIRKHGIKK